MEPKDKDINSVSPKGDAQVQKIVTGPNDDKGASSKRPRRRPQDAFRGKRSPGPGPDKGNAEHRPAIKVDGPSTEYVEKVLSIKRITKVTKGGKKLSFSALVIVGDAKGRVGYGLDKAREVATAIKKSLNMAKKSMVKVQLKGRTISHEIIGVHGAARVLLKPASEGTGVIASGPVRAVCDGAGIHDILTKCHRSNNPINVVKATFNGLGRLKIAKNESVGSNDAGS